MQGLKLVEMIKEQQFLPMFLNFNGGYVGGTKGQHIWLMNELDLEEETLVPTTNLVESVQFSMRISIGNGHKVKTNLYIITMDDMVKPCVVTTILSYVSV